MTLTAQWPLSRTLAPACNKGNGGAYQLYAADQKNNDTGVPPRIHRREIRIVEGLY